MFKLVSVYTLILSIVDSQVYFHCNFDENNSPYKLISNGTYPNLHIQTFHSLINLFDDPILPLSDVTSISKMTNSKHNHHYCQIPYRIHENSKEIFFCTHLTRPFNQLKCLTKDNTTETCVLGQYAYVQLESQVTYTYYIKLNSRTNRLCLSFYYYLTRTNIGAINIRDSDHHQIGRVSQMLYNGWHQAKFNFQPKTTEYYIYFDLQRNNVEYTGEFYIALDEIMITNNDAIETIMPEIFPRYQCDFTTFCFTSNHVRRTDGDDFIHLLKAPTSDITSIHQPTNDNQYCQLPYRINNRNMWFCYDRQCLTINHEYATCSSGFYGLISIDSHERSKTIIDSLNSSTDDNSIEKCLRFFYYFTIDEQRTDWGQQIYVWLRPENRTENRILLTNLTIRNMTENKWEYNEVTFNVLSNNYTFEFVFERNIDQALNETVYFALDNLELYDYNCSYLNSSSTTTTIIDPLSTSTIIVTTTMIKGDQLIPRSTFPPNWGLIISLTLGLGVSLFGLLVGFIVFHCKMKRRIAKARSNSTHSDIPLNSLDNSSNNSEPYETYYF